MIIENINPILCRALIKHVSLLKKILSCKAEYYKEEKIRGTDKKRKVRKWYYKNFLFDTDLENAYFYRGHLERVAQHCDKFGSSFSEKNIFPPLLKIKPKFQLEGITFRPDQLDLMNKATMYETGVIVSPTGSGKTILQLGIMSAYPGKKILLLSHTIGIIKQTFEELKKFGFKDIQQIGGGEQYNGEFSRIVVSTVQSFSKIDPEKYTNYFDIVMVDEAHRVSSLECMYAKILTIIMAQVRLGFTATLPQSEIAQMSLEALVGPVIDEFSIKEASDAKILATPKVKLLKSNFNHDIKDIRVYKDVYQYGVVENKSRNKLIVNTIIDHSKIGDISLIFVTKIEHGENLQKIFSQENENVPFVQGSLSPEEREKIKKNLIEKKLKIAIATVAWREGINIPSLDVIFNAGGGKGELGVLQLIGRGLRRMEGKDTVTIYDIFDPSHHYLISHFGERMCLYFEKGWV